MSSSSEDRGWHPLQARWNIRSTPWFLSRFPTPLIQNSILAYPLNLAVDQIYFSSLHPSFSWSSCSCLLQIWRQHNRSMRRTFWPRIRLQWCGLWSRIFAWFQDQLDVSMIWFFRAFYKRWARNNSYCRHPRNCQASPREWQIAPSTNHFPSPTSFWLSS